MRERLQQLINALREELQQYGEMLALLDRQQQVVISRQADEVFQSASFIQAQAAVIRQARMSRENLRGEVAADLCQPQTASFGVIIPLLPADYQPLVRALVEENNALLARVQHRARQNHLLLRRSLEFMQDFLNTLFPGREPRVYNDQGAAPLRALQPRQLYEAVG
jgi:flagellar biosynthesis/type III secretory pathway chaperone